MIENQAILILAAGASSRMGARDKLMEPVNEQPLLQVMCKRALDTGFSVYVCLPDPEHVRCGVLPDGVKPIWVPDAAEGMAASLRTGIIALPTTVTDVMILPADMPELTTTDLQTVWKSHEPHGLTRGASAEGRPGHPVIFPSDLFRELETLKGDEGAKSVLVRHRQRLCLVPLPKQHALTDLDTPDAWDAWRHAQH
jgi:CTP:molybdopterin cytidylyltransferase MocA